jgi:proline dehydrogenase
VLRRTILAAAGSGRTRAAVEKFPISRAVVRRFVAGETAEDAVDTSRDLIAQGLTVTLDHLGEDTRDVTMAGAVTDAYLLLLSQLAADGLTAGAEVSLKLTALGQLVDPARALENAQRICQAATNAGTTVTLDMEDHTTTDSTLEALRELRQDFPFVGAVLQAYLRRTESDCRDLAYAGSRVRLCKGAYNEPESVAYQHRHEVDLSYVRCLNTLMGGDGFPMIATHDPRLIGIAAERARWFDRKPGSYEYQMLYGVRPEEQRRLAEAGETVRVYVPYGTEWYGYLMRRLAERPANVAFFLRSLASRK